MTSPKLLSTLTEARDWIDDTRRANRTIGLVPTMGALHAGHLSLVAESRKRGHATAVTIFVNPTQFAPHEDFERYPRTLDADLSMLDSVGADAVFAPSQETVYPAGFASYVEPGEVALPYEGRFRPSHFRGVATVVLKLFQMLPADEAFFGQKDYQQSLVIRQMVRDFNLPIQINVCPIIREADGLAMSSRNRYLSPQERERALALSRGLELATKLIAGGQNNAGSIIQQMTALLKAAQVEIDYVAIADRDTLEELPIVDRPAVALIAGRVGATRLIDNRLIDAPPPR